MKARLAKNIQTMCLVLALLLFIISAINPNKVLIIMGTVIGIAGYTVWLIFGRCQKCGEWLGRHIYEHCPHCGEEIE